MWVGVVVVVVVVGSGWRQRQSRPRGVPLKKRAEDEGRGEERRGHSLPEVPFNISRHVKCSSSLKSIITKRAPRWPSGARHRQPAASRALVCGPVEGRERERAATVKRPSSDREVTVKRPSSHRQATVKRPSSDRQATVKR